MLPTLRADATPARAQWPRALRDADGPPGRPTYAPAPAPCVTFAVDWRVEARRAWLGQLTLRRGPLAVPIRPAPRVPRALAPMRPLAAPPTALNPLAPAFVPRGPQASTPSPPADFVHGEQPLAPLAAIVALGLLVVPGPQQEEEAAANAWPHGCNDAHRLLLRALASAGGTRLPPHHVDVSPASFPPPCRELGFRWCAFAEQVQSLDGADFRRAAQLLARAERTYAAERPAVRWALEASHALCAQLRQLLRHNVVLERTGPVGLLPRFSAQTYALAAQDMTSLPPLFSGDDELPPEWVPDDAAGPPWTMEGGAWLLVTGPTPARPAARRPSS